MKKRLSATQKYKWVTNEMYTRAIIASRTKSACLNMEKNMSCLIKSSDVRSLSGSLPWPFKGISANILPNINIMDDNRFMPLLFGSLSSDNASFISDEKQFHFNLFNNRDALHDSISVTAKYGASNNNIALAILDINNKILRTFDCFISSSFKRKRWPILRRLSLILQGKYSPEITSLPSDKICAFFQWVSHNQISTSQYKIVTMFGKSDSLGIIFETTDLIALYKLST